MNPLPYFAQSPLLRSVPGIYHAFLGVDPVEGRGRRERLREVFAVAAETVGTLKQVHSASVLPFEPGDGDVPGGWKREGDALWTASPGTGVGVHTADCVPILLSHRKIRVAAAVHAGWRGLAAGIVEKTVRVLTGRVGEAAVEGIVAVAGPCARGCCYEVGEETADALIGLPGGEAYLRKGKTPGKWTADLQGIALAALRGAGIPAAQTAAEGPCTICSPRYHSFRREKSTTSRQLSFLYIRD
ncbi:MAG TPA: polyphenol oxidase family protein [Candidatus Binatia bacterium]|nr:polyphenol oxidase family protein [Candidatus Binatia bacterium]